ncbi:uncharacterized protein [Nicotiana tomentosiformis]|uniref:uncharacterized protein n=1 Tax=Nicotiana tomentosiformis TaxID=4098 RepID=UPI00388C8E64
MDFGGSWDPFLPLAEFVYGRHCSSPIGWFERGEARLLGTNLVRDALKKLKLVQDRLHIAQPRQKRNADRKVRDVAFMVGGGFGCRLALPLSLSAVHPVFHVSMLQKYYGDPSYVLDFILVQSDKDLTYVEESVAILDRQVRKLRSNNIASVKVQWRCHSVEEEALDT